MLLGEARAVRIFRMVTVWWGAAIGAVAATAALVLQGHDVDGVQVLPVLIIGLGAIAIGIAYLLLGERVGHPALVTLSLAALVGMVGTVYLLGPRFEMAMVVPALAGAQALFYLPRRITIAGDLMVVAAYALLVLTADGYPAPWVRLLIYVGALAATSVVLAWIVGQIERLSQREREAQADLAKVSAELAEANAQLEERVGVQGEEIGSLQRLRQFVSPQVAEALLQDGLEALAPHRSRIAVLFCDLRGFTSFSSSAEPEEVMEVLDEYYATVGRALHEAGATVGSFAGDGIMAYFGDPVPCEDPAGTAVEMAAALNVQMQLIVSRWHRRGYDIGCGFGLAYGFATIGPVGFDGRTDYTALGPTVNLASRLCDQAEHGELLIDRRAHMAVEDRADCEERVVEVRGFPVPVHAHRVTAWRAEPTGARAGLDG